ncbi:hypothetical protein [Roseicyclus persicicus]|uniref:Glycosyltransferase family 1 protein n=1 Tax=Roseicyclus persicicus TaxID=2650661 RepID=A0A7X6H0P5_9RHOB|nr:hypothetical protein [Roseibacterium persicicum]NKX44726.1 hypothetical protein [Roseibacterium persicicum]
MLPLRNLVLEAMRVAWVRTRPRAAIFVFIKDSIDRLSPAALSTLHDRSLAILHDPIDRPISATPRAHVDLHIASSQAQAKALTALLRAWGRTSAKVGLVLHQPDLRLSAATPPPRDRLRAAYFGNPDNAHLPGDLADRVAVHDVGFSDGMARNLQLFGTANFHFAVRPEAQARSDDVIKPLTKAVTAAVCGAPILINRHSHDAEDLLGHDYPYLVNRGDADTISGMLDDAASGFGGPTWREAEDRMRQLRARTTPERTAADFERALGSVL